MNIGTLFDWKTKPKEMPKEAPKPIKLAWCPACNGFGWLGGGTDVQPTAIPCERCQGTGKVTA